MGKILTKEERRDEMARCLRDSHRDIIAEADEFKEFLRSAPSTFAPTIRERVLQEALERIGATPCTHRTCGEYCAEVCAIVREALFTTAPAPAKGDDHNAALRYSEIQLRESVDERCTCGGAGPEDPGVCPACMVWHDLHGHCCEKCCEVKP